MSESKLSSGERFKKLANKLARKGIDDSDANTVRKKYGNKKMAALSLRTKKK